MSEAAPTRAFLVVDSGGSYFALPAMAVATAVAPQVVTPLPFVPAYVEGLVNINERVLPLLDLRRLLAMDVREPTAAASELLVVETRRAPCALRVDRIVAKVDVPVDDVQALAKIDTDAISDAIPDATGSRQSGLVDARFEWQGLTVLAINLEALAEQVAARDIPEGRRGMLGRRQQEAETIRRESQACIVVVAAGEKYAIALEEAVEILDMGPATVVPGAPEVAEGIAIVRDEALLVLSLPRLLRRGNNSAGARNVVVIDRGGTHYGLRVDAVDGILGYDLENLRRIDDETGEVAGVIVEGAQIIGLLGAHRLLPDSRHEALAPFIPSRRSGTDLKAEQRHAVLEVVLGDEAFGIALSMVRRIAEFTAPERLQADAGSLVCGAVSIDGRILPVVDFARLLDFGDGRNEGAWVIVGDADHEWAIPVREARQIIEIPVSAIEEVSTAQQRGLVTAVANVSDHLISLLSMAPLLEAA